MTQPLKFVEWQQTSGSWKFNVAGGVGTKANIWYAGARVLNMSIPDYLQMVIDKYKPSDISVIGDKIMLFSWDDYDMMHKLVLLLNRTAKRRNLVITKARHLPVYSSLGDGDENDETSADAL